eukprot:TRINITY_DN104187_c0_g1_i1.p1 TRINITY_DN104187_c0_g1~~TRINITY_DN104187_c0_g1_i1.p1  ORF type:complete len:261 (+),score=51.33 TRINITY_DN104187_c0_g1_i1:90-785(+)
MASDATVLKDIASRMEVMTMELLESEKSSVPDVLVRPALDLLGEQKEMLYGLIGDAARGPWSATPATAQLEKLAALEGELLELVLGQLSELAEEGGPWHNPPALRKFRQQGEAISKSLSHLRQVRGELMSNAAKDEGKQLSKKAIVPGMAGGSFANFQGGARDTNMTTEQALNMLLEKKDPVWKGSLIGIVHAAGVQELVPINGHLPGKFEFVFAPKSQAAWNLHQYSCNV